MRYFVTFLVFVSLALTSNSRSQQSHPDFSGKWKINRELSDFGEGPEGRRRGPRESVMTIEQDEKRIEIESFSKGRDGQERKIKFKYSLDGKKTKNKMEWGDQESTAVWIDKGRILQIDSSTRVKRGDMEFDMESVQYFSIVDGRLVVDSIRNTPRGEMETRAVYERITGDEE